MFEPSAHLDTFARDRLPPPEEMPRTIFTLPALRFPPRLNCAEHILALGRAAAGDSAPAIAAPGCTWSYARLEAESNRIARVLVEDFRLVPGQRVLLRAPNTPMLAACWFAVLKAGGIVVATMPLLRTRDLVPILEKARVNLALCDARLVQDLAEAQRLTLPFPIVTFSAIGGGDEELDRRMHGRPEHFAAVATARDDVAAIAFTSGTTGAPKGTLHFHSDIAAMGAVAGEHVFRLGPGDTVIGSPPLAFTFGLGALLTFPLSLGASTVLLESAPPQELASAIDRFGATVCATAPTAYRAMLKYLDRRGPVSLRRCVSAGEHLPLQTFRQWHERTGIPISNGLGTTEMTHMFIGATDGDIRPGAIGRALPGYEVCILGPDNRPLPPGQSGRLAVRGPTGCKYLEDPRQRDYVVEGWNVTGDICVIDADGYVWYECRSDDMIVSAGYNISGPEVEQALLPHPAVQECAVVAAPDPERGFVVMAFVVPSPGYTADAALTRTLQDFVKQSIAPYKYPRVIEYVDALPKTQTGKLQRSELRARAARAGH
jgi:2-aminobenzoate-CoA ligase